MDYLEIRELYHHGIKGQKWGIRRFQNEDGSLTAEGKKRYQVNDFDGSMTKEGKKLYKQDQKQVKIANRSKAKQGVIGGLKGMGIAEVGALAATGALAITGAMILKNENVSLSQTVQNGKSLLKASDILSKAIYVAVPVATAVGAGVAIKKQEKTRDKLNNQ
ncbi:MAG: hypothetical protein IKR19_00555 [Acholeplasmatales bacterium]|nr:hypothetical protein [Acholeplasmatales bacterium]